MGTVPAEGGGIPSWLDREFIASALKRGEPKTDESSVQLKTVRKVVGGLLSETYRVVAQSNALGESCDRDTSVIVKSSPNVGGFRKELAESGVFTKEKIAYGNFLPAVDAALAAVEGQNWRALAPKFYHCGSQPTNFLVIEDLDASGFRGVPQGVSLNVDQCRVVLQNLARMHATSVALLHHQQYANKLFRQALIFTRRLVEQFKPKDQNDMNSRLLVQNDFTWLRRYKTKIEQLWTHLVEDTVDVVEQCQVNFKVMVHGDLHKNNMMFREDSDGLQVRFFDFQGIHIGSPAEDLQYFLYSSASLEVLRGHTEGLLREYHGVLQQTLRSLGMHQQADAYPLQQLLRDMDHFGMISVFTTFYLLPFVINFSKTDFAMDTTDAEYEENTMNFFEMCWKDEKYVEYLEYLVPVFDSKGFFDRKV